jgi:hypothetical protein
MSTTAAVDRFGVPLRGWSLVVDPADDGECAVRVECARCGDPFYTDDPADDPADDLCPAYLMPPTELAALRAMVPAPARVARETCDTCGFYPIAATLTRCPACTRFYARLDANWAEYTASRFGGDAIAA